MANPIMDLLGKAKALVTGAQSGEEKREAGPGDVGPTLQTRGNSELVTLEMTEEEVGEWWTRVERAEARIKAREEAWDVLLDDYSAVVKKSGDAETIRVMGHFRDVHTKMGQLFYRSPDLILSAKDPSPAQNQMPNPMTALQPPGAPPLPPLTMEDIIAVKQAVLMSKLGRDGIKADRLMDELLFDNLAWAGIACMKLGYRCVTKPYSEPIMVPDPNHVPDLMNPQPPPMVPQMGEDGQPMKKPPVDVPIYEEYYARRFSPKKLLVNDDLRSTRFDEDATFMGMRFFMSPKSAKRLLKLTDEEVAKATSDERIHKYKEDQQGSSKPPGLVSGVEIICKASYFTDEVHPLAMCQLILIDGIRDRPIVWRPSPDQEFDEMGRLTPDSLIGFPYQVLTIRDLADSCFPQSDAAFTNGAIKELSTWRRQSILLRDAAIGKYFYDSGAFEDTEIEILKNGAIGSFVGVRDGLLAGGADKIFTTTRSIQATQDDYRGQELIKQDRDETLGISSWQAGAPQDTVRTATEVASVATAVASRNDKELGRVVDFYLDLARKIDQLLMRYSTEQEYVQIAGTEGARRMQLWNNQMISGRYLYDISPDSQLRVDTARDFDLDAKFYNLAAPDPLTNRAYILRRLARRRGMDPAKVIYDPMTMAPQPPHGGPATDGATVNQHEQGKSGKRPNEPGAENHRDKEAAS